MGASFRPQSIEHLRQVILQRTPLLFLGHQTGRVLPPLEALAGQVTPCFLDSLPTNLELDKENNILTVTGPVSFKEAKSFLRSFGLDLPVWPTEKLASILASVATSATGERSFGLGPLKKHLLTAQYMDFEGQIITLSMADKMPPFDGLKDYQDSFGPYRESKNGPFPRLERMADILVGSEGQLGPILKASFKVIPWRNTVFLAAKLPRWELDFAPHLELHQKAQDLRDQVLSVEFLDSNSLKLAGHSHEGDLIVMEVLLEKFDQVVNEFLSTLALIKSEHFFEMSESQVEKLRFSVPSKLSEALEKNHQQKLGTDIQVGPESFSKLLKAYRDLSAQGVDYILFGHFGDAHLHFNFIPQNDEQRDMAKGHIFHLYQLVVQWKSTPFAEHGIGLLKKDIVKLFWSKAQYQVFDHLKKTHDPYGQFFPLGFMSWKES